MQPVICSAQSRVRHSTKRKLLLLAGVPAIALLATAVLLWDGLHDEIRPADVALVLGNTVNPDGTPSDRLAARLDRSLELFQQGTFPLIIVSGAVGKEGHDEATVMRDYLTARGVPSSQIIVDSAGNTTFASAKNTAVIMRQKRLKSVLVISQYFHVRFSYRGLPASPKHRRRPVTPFTTRPCRAHIGHCRQPLTRWAVET